MPDSDPAAIGEKCGMDMDMPMMMAQPLSGATSFAEAEAYDRAEDSAEAVQKLTATFNAIVQNILGDMDMGLGDKADAVVQAARDLKTRLQSDPEVNGLPEADDGGVGDAAAGAGFLARLGFKKKMDEVGGVTVDRSKIPAADFAGPGRSFPITNPASVAAAAQSLGRAKGDTAPIKAKIIAIARRKGAAHVAQLPAAWNPGAKDAADEAAEGETTAPHGTFRASKDRRGDMRWTAIYTNKYEDREGEIFPYARHEEFESWVAQTKAYPELRLWHVPGTRLGEADMVALDSGGFMLATGTFDAGRKEASERLAALGPLAVSHGYFFDTKDDGVFGAYRTFEISPLPLGREANELGGFSVTEDATMLKPAQKEFLSNVLGPTEVNSLEAQLATLGQRAKAKGLNFKEWAPELGTVISDGIMSGFKDGGEATPPASAPPPAGTFDAAALAAALAPVLAPITARLDQLAADQHETSAAVKALATDDDTKISNMFAPRLGAVIPSQGQGAKGGGAGAGALEDQAAAGLKTDDPTIPPALAAHFALMGATGQQAG